MLQRTLGDSHIIAPYPAQANRTINPQWETVPVFIYFISSVSVSVSVFSVSI